MRSATSRLCLVGLSCDSLLLKRVAFILLLGFQGVEINHTSDLSYAVHELCYYIHEGNVSSIRNSLIYLDSTLSNSIPGLSDILQSGIWHTSHGIFYIISLRGIILLLLTILLICLFAPLSIESIWNFFLFTSTTKEESADTARFVVWIAAFCIMCVLSHHSFNYLHKIWLDHQFLTFFAVEIDETVDIFGLYEPNTRKLENIHIPNIKKLLKYRQHHHRQQHLKQQQENQHPQLQLYQYQQQQQRQQQQQQRQQQVNYLHHDTSSKKTDSSVTQHQLHQQHQQQQGYNQIDQIKLVFQDNNQINDEYQSDSDNNYDSEDDNVIEMSTLLRHGARRDETTSRSIYSQKAQVSDINSHDNKRGYIEKLSNKQPMRHSDTRTRRKDLSDKRGNNNYDLRHNVRQRSPEVNFNYSDNRHQNDNMDYTEDTDDTENTDDTEDTDQTSNTINMDNRDKRLYRNRNESDFDINRYIEHSDLSSSTDDSSFSDSSENSSDTDDELSENRFSTPALLHRRKYIFKLQTIKQLRRTVRYLFTRVEHLSNQISIQNKTYQPSQPSQRGSEGYRDQENGRNHRNHGVNIDSQTDLNPTVSTIKKNKLTNDIIVVEDSYKGNQLNESHIPLANTTLNKDVLHHVMDSYLMKSSPSLMKNINIIELYTLSQNTFSTLQFLALSYLPQMIQVQIHSLFQSLLHHQKLQFNESQVVLASKSESHITTPTTATTTTATTTNSTSLSGIISLYMQQQLHLSLLFSKKQIYNPTFDTDWISAPPSNRSILIKHTLNTTQFRHITILASSDPQGKHCSYQIGGGHRIGHGWFIICPNNFEILITSSMYGGPLVYPDIPSLIPEDNGNGYQSLESQNDAKVHTDVTSQPRQQQQQQQPQQQQQSSTRPTATTTTTTTTSKPMDPELWKGTGEFDVIDDVNTYLALHGNAASVYNTDNIIIGKKPDQIQETSYSSTSASIRPLQNGHVQNDLRHVPEHEQQHVENDDTLAKTSHASDTSDLYLSPPNHTKRKRRVIVQKSKSYPMTHYLTNNADDTKSTIKDGKDKSTITNIITTTTTTQTTTPITTSASSISSISRHPLASAPEPEPIIMSESDYYENSTELIKTDPAIDVTPTIINLNENVVITAPPHINNIDIETDTSVEDPTMYQTDTDTDTNIDFYSIIQTKSFIHPITQTHTHSNTHSNITTPQLYPVDVNLEANIQDILDFRSTNTQQQQLQQPIQHESHSSTFLSPNFGGDVTDTTSDTTTYNPYQVSYGKRRVVKPASQNYSYQNQYHHQYSINEINEEFGVKTVDGKASKNSKNNKSTSEQRLKKKPKKESSETKKIDKMTDKIGDSKNNMSKNNLGNLNNNDHKIFNHHILNTPHKSATISHDLDLSDPNIQTNLTSMIIHDISDVVSDAPDIPDTPDIPYMSNPMEISTITNNGNDQSDPSLTRNSHVKLYQKQDDITNTYSDDYDDHDGEDDGRAGNDEVSPNDIHFDINNNDNTNHMQENRNIPTSTSTSTLSKKSFLHKYKPLAVLTLANPFLSKKYKRVHQKFEKKYHHNRDQDHNYIHSNDNIFDDNDISRLDAGSHADMDDIDDMTIQQRIELPPHEELSPHDELQQKTERVEDMYEMHNELQVDSHDKESLQQLPLQQVTQQSAPSVNLKSTPNTKPPIISLEPAKYLRIKIWL